MFLGYVLIVLKPGRMPPRHPQSTSSGPPSAPGKWTLAEYQAFIDEGRRLVDMVEAGKRDARSRAQVVLTTALVLGGAIVTSFSRQSEPGFGLTSVYLLAAAVAVLTVLAAGGIMTARAPTGTPDLDEVLSTATGGVLGQLADEYAASRHLGAASMTALVTVLRDCVLALVLGAGLLAIAHLAA